MTAPLMCETLLRIPAKEILRRDLDEERRCVAEIEDDKENLQSDFPDIVRLLDRIKVDAEKIGRKSARCYYRATSRRPGSLVA
ncbi:MAG: hypothetical protein ACXW6T_12920 [Candidatus Binatia bacterium]